MSEARRGLTGSDPHRPMQTLPEQHHPSLRFKPNLHFPRTPLRAPNRSALFSVHLHNFTSTLYPVLSPSSSTCVKQTQKPSCAGGYRSAAKVLVVTLGQAPTPKYKLTIQVYCTARVAQDTHTTQRQHCARCRRSGGGGNARWQGPQVRERRSLELAKEAGFWNTHILEHASPLQPTSLR
jgi:hypothetical protein